MGYEKAVRIMFPQVDARLIKVTVSDGDDMDSAVDPLLKKEGMQSYEQKPVGNLSPDGHYVHVDDILLMPNSKKHHATCDQDEEHLTDFDKHEESIVWKGGFKSNAPMHAKLFYPDQEHDSEDSYGSYCRQEQAILAGNQEIDWWATTWPNVAGPKDDRDMCNSFSDSSVHTDSDTQAVGGKVVWRNMELYKPIQQKVLVQEVPIVDVDCFSTSSNESLEKERTSLGSPGTGLINSETSSRSLAELGLPLSQEYSTILSSKILNSEALEASILEVERSDSRSGNSHGFASDGNSNISSRQSTNVKCVREVDLSQESLLDSSRYNINTDDLDKFLNEAKLCKENVRKDMEDIYLLRQRAEQEEMAAQIAKTEAASGGLEMFLKVEDMRQQVSSQRAKFEMRAGEIYGEKSVLAMEARELKARLLETQAEQAKALSLLDSIRCSLSARLEKASQEKQFAMAETKVKVKKAEELLASEQASVQKLEQGFKVLEAEAETCKKLREFLIERGNIVDSLQGEMAVLCEDVLTFKEQVDAGIPMSASSRSLSWSRMSHLTERCLHASLPDDAKDSGRESRCTPLESSACLNSISSTSILTLSLATLESSKTEGPIECALQSRLFSSGSSMVDTAEQGSSKGAIKGKTKEGQEEAGEGVVESLDSIDEAVKEKAENLQSAGSGEFSFVEAEIS